MQRIAILLLFAGTVLVGCSNRYTFYMKSGDELQAEYKTPGEDDFLIKSAILMYGKAIKEKPTDEALFNYAVCAEELDNSGSNFFDTLINKNSPYKGLACYHKARIYERDSLYDSAIYWVSKALAIDDKKLDKAKLFQWRGIMNFSNGDSKAALADLNNSIKLNGNDWNTFAFKGDVLRAMGICLYKEAYESALDKLLNNELKNDPEKINANQRVLFNLRSLINEPCGGTMENGNSL